MICKDKVMEKFICKGVCVSMYVYATTFLIRLQTHQLMLHGADRIITNIDYTSRVYAVKSPCAIPSRFQQKVFMNKTKHVR